MNNIPFLFCKLKVPFNCLSNVIHDIVQFKSYRDETWANVIKLLSKFEKKLKTRFVSQTLKYSKTPLWAKG
jgi:hypothetical protein